MPRRPLRRYCALVCAFVLITSLLTSLSSSARAAVRGLIFVTPPYPLPRHPLYKTDKKERPPPVKDNFPLAENARSAKDLPPIPSWNRPPKVHVPEVTPLFIGFTRNWLLLQQTVVSYITAGWPPEDIYVVENTGTVHANKNGQLSLQNPFYLNHTRLKTVFGVNIIQTPTLLGFAQLQNFYIFQSAEKGWPYYYWSHMDVLALPEETWTDEEDGGKYKSLYMRTVDDLRSVLKRPATDRLAMKFFAYDRFTFVNRSAYEEVGGWDTMIPYYGTDCDMYERLSMANLTQEDARNGLVYDVGTSIDDLLTLYRRSPDDPDKEDTLASEGYLKLRQRCDELQVDKLNHPGGRNFWQAAQSGGQGEPFYRDIEGFEWSVWLTIKHGENLMADKWGHRGCRLRGAGLGLNDAWQVERDWEYWDKHPKELWDVRTAGWPEDKAVPW